jgi:hypothetical protein
MCLFETSVYFHQTTRRHISEDSTHLQSAYYVFVAPAISYLHCKSKCWYASYGRLQDFAPGGGEQKILLQTT